MTEIDDLAAVENSLSALKAHVDGEEVLERFGSLFGVYEATKSELKAANVKDRAAEYFRCADDMVCGAVAEKRLELDIKSKGDVMRYISALCYRRRDVSECLLCLDEGGKVQKPLCFYRSVKLNKIIGTAIVSGASAFIWVKVLPRKDGARHRRRRIRIAEHVRSVLEKIGIYMLDYMEYRAALLYSASAKRYVDMTADISPQAKTKRNEVIATEEVIENGRTVRHGRNTASDGSGQIHAGVL